MVGSSLDQIGTFGKVSSMNSAILLRVKILDTGCSINKCNSVYSDTLTSIENRGSNIEYQYVK